MNEPRQPTTTDGPGSRGGSTEPGSVRGTLFAWSAVLPRVRKLAAWVLAAAVLFSLPDLVQAVPFEIQVYYRHPLFPMLVAFALLTVPWSRSLASMSRRLVAWAIDRISRTRPGTALRRAGSRWGRAAVALARRGLGPLEQPSAWALRAPLTGAVVTMCALMLLTWVPHYLTWPWWCDTDQFATSALNWEAGERPFAELADFDFPGPIFLFALLGKTVGWGRPVLYNALDASFVVFLGAALACWSRRRFGRALAGVVGYLAFLMFYLTRDYTMIAQREWHATLLVVLGLLALEAFPGRAARLGSALALAAALAYRPQQVLLFPAVLSALLERSDWSGREQCAEAAGPVRSVVEWSVAFAVALALVFSPLIVSGVMDDFVRALQVARYGGSYNKTTWLVFSNELHIRYVDKWTVREVLALVLCVIAGPDWLRGPGRTWGLALLGTLLYRPISPVVGHGYLDQPWVLIRAIGLAVPLAWVLTARSLAAPLRLAAIAAVIVAVAPEVPKYCLVARSVEALGTLARGEEPEIPPPGCEHFFTPKHPYAWSDYRRLLAYLRTSTAPTTRVGNVLRTIPLPALNGPTGRATLFPAAGGVIHLWNVDPGLADAFVSALERADDAVVVWIPNEPRAPPDLKLPEIEQAIRQYYQPEACFGTIEVWRRMPALPVSATVADAPRGG